MRRVVVIFGPPGAGKSTLARTLGLPVHDLDEFDGTDAQFRTELAELRGNPTAQAAVVRCDPYSDTAEMCGATEQILLATSLSECVKRIRTRGRRRPSIRVQIAAAQSWWRRFENQDCTIPRAESAVRRRKL